MALIPQSPAAQTTTSAPEHSQDEILYQNERTQVFRQRLTDGVCSLVCKRPLGPKAAIRLRHERRILERLAGVKGVLQPSTKNPSTDVIAFEDGGFVSLAEAAQDKRFEIPALIALALQLADIIAAVHHAGVVHKDISPANILLGGLERQPMLIDFDLATTFAEERPGFIQPQDIAGTLAYIAPEQTGRSGRAVDQRADLYSLGAVLYELAVGHPPFDASHDDPLQLIHQILAQAPKPPAELDLRIPAALSDILLRLLEKEPDRRYQSAEGLKADLLRLREMLARGENDTFPLGEHDYPLRLLPPSRLIGREREIGILQSAFDNALHGRGSGVLVSGAPGVGKSALINELRPIVTARRGWFVSGKFDQYRQDVAGEATGQALRALMQLILAAPEAELAQHKTRVLKALGNNAGFMAALLPGFATTFDVTPEPATGDPIQMAQRLIQAGLDLLRASASPQRPLVMVIDDLQWAGAASLDFIDAIVTDNSLRGLLLVASYRESEVDATHPLAAVLSRWERLNTLPMQLHLDNLPPGDLALLLAEMLRLSGTQADALAQAIGAHTGGNPFDTVELVNALRHDGALTLSADGWQWDAATIQRYIGQGEVIDLLTARISRLPAAARSLLDTMACLGGELEFGRLAAAGGVTAAEAEEQLAPALEDGLLVMESSNITVRFRHDRVQQAAYAQLEPAARTALHLALARRVAALPEFAAVAAEQYLSAIDAIDDNAERRRVVDLLHAAATQARQVSNYTLTERLLVAALALLNKAHSAQEETQDEALLLALEIAQHTVLYSLGRLDEVDDVYASVKRRCHDPLGLVDVTCMQMRSLTNRARPHESMALGLDLLRQLGLETPQDIGGAIAERIGAVLDWVSTLDKSEDMTRMEVSDPRVLAVATLLAETQAPTLSCNPALYAWLALENQHQWVEHGPSPQQITSLCGITAHVIALRQDYRAAYAIAQHVRAVNEARHYDTAKPMAGAVLVTFTDHWFEPLDNNISHAQMAREALLQQGNLLFACYTYFGELPALFDCVPSLDACVDEFEAALAFAARTGNGHSGAVFVPYRQLLRTLRGETEVPGSFDSADFNEATHLSSLDANPTAAAYYQITRAISAMMFGDTPGLIQYSSAAMPLLVNTPGFYVTALAHLLQALALAERIKAAEPNQTNTLLAEFDTCRDWLTARAADAPMNFLHLSQWIDAERAWATDDFHGAITGFEAALAEVAPHQRPWHRALITERAGLFHLKHGLEHTGRMLLNEARHLYDAWGASAKVEQMTSRHDFLRGGSGQRRKTDGKGSGSISTDSLDLVGIVRASQALSSETDFARLRIRMAELVRELTGATHIRGVLWYEDKQEWCLPPPLDQGETAKPIPVEEAGLQGLLPLSVFNYVVRTREPLLVDDALKDDRFRHDPYFAGVGQCSLLGVPVFNQGVMRLVLVMENRLSHGAFTADRLAAVNLIAGQLVISIDNVQMYASLERKVAERTEDLKLANQRLEALSSTDPLTGLANRRRFNDVIEAEWQRAMRPQTSIGVAMIDIDQFKLYNDHYGHLGGDECLRRVARALDKSVRGGSDLVARYGGEEFVIVLPGADLAAVYPVAERARAAVEALLEPHEKSGHGIVTISVGIAAMIPSEQGDTEALVELADAALYRAKKNGRNQVVGRRADELPEPDEQQVQQIPDKSKPVATGTLGVTTAQALRLLMIEDSATDAELILRELKRGLATVQYERVDSAAALTAALDRQAWDIVICDYHLPNFGALPALTLVRQRADYLPFIIVSGVIREETAVEAMKHGVDDYVLKSNLARLVPAIGRELETNETRRSNALAEKNLKESERRFRDLLGNVELASVMLDRDAQITYCNDYLLRLTDWRREDVIGQNWFELFMPPELGDMKTVFLALLADSPDAWHRDNEIFTRSRERRLVRWNNSVLRSGAGEVIGIASIGEDITEQKQSEEKIRRLNRVYTVLSGINTLIVRARDRNELYREACRIAVEAGQFVNADISMFDHEMKELTIVASSSTNAQYLEQVRKMHRTVLDADSPEMKTVHDRLFVQRQVLVINNVEHDLAPSMRGPSRSINAGSLCVLPLVIAERTIGVFVLRAREAGFFDAEETKLLVELAGDIAFALDHLDKTAKLDYLAYYDQLTGLANATLFRERLAQSLLAAKGQPLALALLDVERFKTLNDALGRPAGDTLLKQLAGRLVDCIGSPDQVAHLDADHFALILTDAKNPDEVARMIEHELRYALAEPFLIDGTDFTAAVKIGIALSPGDGADADTLFRNAEAALKKAKAGGERYLFYAQHMTERVAERLALENKLRRALEREEFVLHYQPKVALDTRRIVGVEALIRWNDPATGLVPPMQFIPLMEETGLILQVGAWALRQAVKDHQRWLALGLAAPRIAVNVSAIQLRQNDFVEGVRRILAEGGSPPGIDIEITESLIMDDVEGNIGKLNAIRDMGLVIAIDDFGTGYSSLAYLARLPVGTVKIDRSFIITMLQEPNTMTLVSTTISLAHSLGLKVVAEGVDKEEQAAVLRSLGCDEMQGYLFSKPVPFEEMSALISNVGDSTTRQDRP